MSVLNVTAHVSPIEAALADRLFAEHQGRERAITAEALGRVFDLGPRAVGQLVEDLVEDFGLPIGSSCGKPPGYYWIIAPEEIEATCRNLRARAMGCLVRESRLRKMHLEELLGQLRLEARG